MDYLTLDLLLTLLEKSCVVAVFAYLVVHSPYFKEIVEGKFTWKNQAILILAFGLISVYGTIAGIPVDGGAVANIRDMGPMIGGLIGGPVVGIGAGLIGGIHRYSVGGFTAATCSASAVISGALGGAVYLLYRKKFVGIPGTVALCIVAVGIDLGLALAFARPYEDIWKVVQLISLPMISANAAGSAVFGFIVDRSVGEEGNEGAGRLQGRTGAEAD
jgi:sigma-B regulation protein RsbU (phosphoserine phosphatase)